MRSETVTAQYRMCLSPESFNRMAEDTDDVSGPMLRVTRSECGDVGDPVKVVELDHNNRETGRHILGVIHEIRSVADGVFGVYFRFEKEDE